MNSAETLLEEKRCLCFLYSTINRDAVFVSGMLGQNGELPSVEAANKRLDMMIQAIHQGMLKGMIAFNREGIPMELSRLDIKSGLSNKKVEKQKQAQLDLT